MEARHRNTAITVTPNKRRKSVEYSVFIVDSTLVAQHPSCGYFFQAILKTCNKA